MTQNNEFQSAASFLKGGGEMEQRIRDLNWDSTPLGAIDTWPQSLKTSVSLMLNSQHPMWIGWGPLITFLYNDAYIEVLSLSKHPAALGQPAFSVWSEIWDICGPLAEKVFTRGEASYLNDVRLFMKRGNLLEETFYSFSYSPIRDESGNVGGLFCPSSEVTPKVLNTRRLRVLAELAAESLTQKSPQGACRSAAAIFGNSREDIPFALIYLVDSSAQAVVLEQAVGLQKGLEQLSPLRVDLDPLKVAIDLWPIGDVILQGQPCSVDLHGWSGFPLGPANQAIEEALLLPLMVREQDRPFGVVVAGINPTRKLDDEYRTFYNLVARHIATAIQNARSVEEEKNRADALAALNRAKTTFFSNVSHELRTPLTLIMGPLEDEIRERHGSSERLELAHRNSLRLLKLVNTLLDFSRIEVGRTVATFELTDLSSFTRELASLFRSGMERVGLELIVDCPAVAMVHVDREMWEKVVFNLLSNAFKFTAYGKVEIQLRDVLLENGVNQVRLSVRDTGIGIAPSELSQIFERFHRATSSWSRSHEGTGIGLALVKELVQLHGGVIQVESVEGCGTQFTIDLPVGSGHLPQDQIVSARTTSTSEATLRSALPYLQEADRWMEDEGDATVPSNAEERNISNRTIDANVRAARSTVVASSHHDLAEPTSLIVLADDNSDMRHYIERLLVGAGYQVISVANGAEALKATKESLPSLVLSDVMMPYLDGFDLLHELRKDSETRSIPVILLSARAGEEARIDGVGAGANDYITKPFGARELLARVASHIEFARVRQQAAAETGEATAKFRALFDQSSNFAAILSPEGTILEANKQCLEKCGYQPEDAINQSFWQGPWWRGNAENRHTLQNAIAAAAQGEQYVGELELLSSDGTKRVIELSLNPIRDEKGKIILLYPTGLDITERFQLQKRSDFLSQLTQKVSGEPDADEVIRIVTREVGRYLNGSRCYFFQQIIRGELIRVLADWHSAAQNSLAGEYEAKKFGPSHWVDAFHQSSISVDNIDTHPTTIDFVATYRAVEIAGLMLAPFSREGKWVACLAVTSKVPRHWTMEEKLLLESVMGRAWPLIERARIGKALRTSEEAVRKANHLLADKAAHLEEVVQQRTQKLNETIGELEAFSYSIAHDMRAPLRSMKGFSEILLADYESSLDTAAGKYLKRISSSADRMDHLIQDVLNYSRVVRNDLPLVKVAVDQLLRGIMESYPAFADNEAEILITGTLPTVLGNEAMLTQVLSNLLGNAVKFVATGKKPCVKIWATESESLVRIFIQDNGIGIPLDQQSKIFNIFQQVNKNFEGTGIGLAIVKKAVERMHGSVGLRSELGQGSTFWIELMLASV